MSNNKQRFALVGAAGFVAPRHFQAIAHSGDELVAALDPHDGVGSLDKFFPDCRFFTEPERFERHLAKLRRENHPIHWLSVCTPNWLHDVHCWVGMRNGADIICEKPLVLKPHNLDALREAEQRYERRVYTVMQLRYHRQIAELRQRIKTNHDVELTYVTGRGPWYGYSWKGTENRSGGLIFNIGIHFLDLLIWLFGEVQAIEVHHRDTNRIAGYLELEHARVKWYLSTSFEDVPTNEINRMTYRNLSIDDMEVDLSNGFSDLHTKVYLETLGGQGVGIDEAAASIELAHKIRHQDAELIREHAHPFLELI